MFFLDGSGTDKLGTFILNCPIGIAPSGTVGGATNSNKIILGAALNDAWPGCYLYLVADAAGPGKPAGFYYVEMSSTTEGLVYDTIFNPLSKTLPQPPDTLVPVIGYASAAAYTGHGATINDVLQIPLPGGYIGKNGKIFLHVVQDNNISGAAKGISVKFGGEYIVGSGSLGINAKSSFAEVVNQGAHDRNIFLTNINNNNPNKYVKNIDTGSAQEITASLILNASTDHTMISYLSIEVVKKN